MAAIDTAGLAKRYGDVRALDGLDLTVASGELYGLLGPNGAGKTTTIEILTGQLAPDEGRVEVLGLDPTAEPVAVREQVGILPEQESPPSFMTPREYFDFVGTVRAIDAETLDERVAGWADRLSYAGKLDTLSTDLSRGQQQKVMLTQAFLHEPSLVVIDEPLANLDPIVQERVKRFLVAYREAGNTVLVSTHNVDVAETVCSKVGVVSEGRLVTERRPVELSAGESLLDVFLAEVGDNAGELSTATPTASVTGADGDG